MVNTFAANVIRVTPACVQSEIAFVGNNPISVAVDSGGDFIVGVLPFNLLSDESLKFTMNLSMPTFEVEGKTLIRRITLICDNGTIIKVFYPVFPPDQSARNVIDYLDEQVA